MEGTDHCSRIGWNTVIYVCIDLSLARERERVTVYIVGLLLPTLSEAHPLGLLFQNYELMSCVVLARRTLSSMCHIQMQQAAVETR
jgi:hypothetical protein